MINILNKILKGLATHKLRHESSLALTVLGKGSVGISVSLVRSCVRSFVHSSIHLSIHSPEAMYFVLKRQQYMAGCFPPLPAPSLLSSRLTVLVIKGAEAESISTEPVLSSLFRLNAGWRSKAYLLSKMDYSTGKSQIQWEPKTLYV